MLCSVYDRENILMGLSISRYASQSVRQSVSQSLSRSVSQPISQSVTHTITQSVSQSVSQSVCRSVSHAITQSVCLSVYRSVSQSVCLSVCLSVGTCGSDRRYESKQGSITHRINQFIAEPQKVVQSHKSDLLETKHDDLKT